MMVLVEHVETRAELAEAMGNLLVEIRKLTRRGHEGKHRDCYPCVKYADLHAELNFLLVAWQAAAC